MGQQRRAPDRPNAPQRLRDSDLQTIIQGSDIESAQALVKAAKAWGTYLAKVGLTSSQIRGIFGQVRQIEMNWPPDIDDPERARRAARDLILLKPKLVYQAARDAEKNKNTQPVRQLEEILSPAIDLIQEDRGKFQRFVDFFEAILAYHRSAGGK